MPSPARGGRTAYSPDTKAAAMAALLSGQSVSAVASEYKIPEGTIKAWASRVRQSAEVAAVAGSVATQKKAADIGELLIGYLRANLTTLEAQMVVFRDPVWLAKQDAAGVAVLHGVLTDKAVRLLEALGGAGSLAVE